MNEPLELAPIEARNVGAEVTNEWCEQAANDRRALLAEVKRLRAQLVEAREQRDELRVHLRNSRAFNRQLETQTAKVRALHARQDIPAYVHHIDDEDGDRHEQRAGFSSCAHCGGSTYPCRTVAALAN